MRNCRIHPKQLATQMIFMMRSDVYTITLNHGNSVFAFSLKNEFFELLIQYITVYDERKRI